MDGVVTRPARHRLSADEYHQMAVAGIFGEDDRIELIDGDLIDMAPIGQMHAGVVGGLAQALFAACAGRAIVWPQNPICLDPASEPQPDLAILRSRADFYRTGERPGPADVLLLIEVADSSLKFDREVKLPLYARAEIAEVWIVDVQRRAVEVYRKPAGDSYVDVSTCTPADQVALALAPEIVVQLGLAFG